MVVLDVKGSRLQPFKTHRQEIFQLNAPPVQFPSKASSKRETGKAYILLFACSLTRAIHLELLSDQTTEGFIKSFKRFIAGRGRPQKVYSDNGRSFVPAARWLRGIMRDEKMLDYLSRNHMTW